MLLLESVQARWKGSYSRSYGSSFTDDELIHRACLLWLSGKTRKRTFLKKVAELLLSGRREEARAILLAWEL